MTPSISHFAAVPQVQTFVIGTSGNYLIEAAGAQGGANSAGPGGLGAVVRGKFFLRAGERLSLVVGARGQSGSHSPHAPAGGGGGSFVWRATDQPSRPSYPLIAAGGGGGGAGHPGLATAEGGHGAAPGGFDGLGGECDQRPFSYGGGGGTGWRGDGGSAFLPNSSQGGAFSRGGRGAQLGSHRGGDGGFGGGGGGSFFGHGSGGGGGYSGGGGGSERGPGPGGGGSFNAGGEPFAGAGLQVGDGVITLTLIEALADIHPLPFRREPSGMNAASPPVTLTRLWPEWARLPEPSRSGSC
jgi:hypothetical protein